MFVYCLLKKWRDMFFYSLDFILTIYGEMALMLKNIHILKYIPDRLRFIFIIQIEHYLEYSFVKCTQDSRESVQKSSSSVVRCKLIISIYSK